MLPDGPRSQKLVVLTVIAGAPPDLVHSGMTDNDWSALLGRDPMVYDFHGTHPRMVQSITPRAGLPAPKDASVPPLERERETAGSDLQYACSFLLDAPRVCGADDGDCGCSPSSSGAQSPLCLPNAPNTQFAAGAYPGVRVFQLARLLGDNAVTSSICPPPPVKELAPSVAYRPAMGQLGDRMARSLVGSVR